MIEPFGRGGICHYAFNLCNSLSRYVNDLILISAKDYEIEIVPTKFKLFKILHGMNKNDLKVLRLIKALFNPILVIENLRNYRPNFIHFQSSFIPILDLIVIKVVRRHNIRIIFTAHEVRFSTSRGKRFLLDNLLERILIAIYRNSDILIVHSNYARKALVELLRDNSKEILKLPHGLQDIQLFSANLEYDKCLSELGLNNSDFHALFFGSLRNSKGLDLLLMSLPKIVHKIPNFRLLVAGEIQSTTNLDYLMNLVKTLGLKDSNVRFDIRYIPMQDVYKYFKVSSMVILPYRENYQSGVLSTAFAFGKPVVSSSAGDFIEHVKDGINGYLVEDVENINILAEKIVDMASDKCLLSKMSAEAERYGKTNLDWDVIAESLHSTLQKHMGKVLNG